MTTNWGDNPAQPMNRSDAYLPDQLIAGHLNLVTETPVLIYGGGSYKRGTVMGRATAAIIGAPVYPATNVGDGTIGSIAATVLTEPGVYKVTFLTATTYNVTTPKGKLLTAGSGSSYSDPQLSFTFTAHTNAMVAGDTISFPVSPAANAYTPCITSASDGSQTPAAILVDDADTTAGDAMGGVYVMGEFNANAIIYDASLSIPTIKAALIGKGIFFKPVITANDPS